MNLISRYATNTIVQPGQNEIIIAFFETQIPPLVGLPEENAAALEQSGAIKAECVARIIMAPDQIPGLIEALRTGYEAFRVAKASELAETNATTTHGEKAEK